MNKKQVHILGIILGFGSLIGLCIIDWKIGILIFLAITGNNLTKLITWE